MDLPGSRRSYVIIFIAVLVSLAGPTNGQISTACTSSMVSSFTPCMNFVTGSSNNGTSPTTSCCGALKDIIANGVDCACLLITANVPFQLPINRSLALTLPRACNMDGVPIQCKSAGSPLPSPGADSLGPSVPPTTASSPLSPRASKVSAIAPSPQAEAIEKLSPTDSPAVGSGNPTRTSAVRPVLNPTTSSSSVSGLSSLLQLIVVALFVSWPIISFL